MNKDNKKSLFFNKFIKKLSLAQAILLTIFMVILTLTARNFLKEYVISQSEGQLSNSLNIVKETLIKHQISPLNWCKGLLSLDISDRFTLINRDGYVLCDTEKEPKELSFHGDRPEIKMAFKKGHGSHQRLSESINKELLYYAVLIKGETQDKDLILRAAIPLTVFEKGFREIDKTLLTVFFPLLIFFSLIIIYASFKFAFPLNHLLSKIKKLDQTNNPTYLLGKEDDWPSLEKTLDLAHSNMEKVVANIQLENEKFSRLMESISDSILAVGLNHRILFINNQFKENFLNDQLELSEFFGKKIWELFRNADLSTMFEKCIRTETLSKMYGFSPTSIGNALKYFDVTVSPLKNTNGTLFGVVAIFHDITDRKLTEQMREDFVANVGHEVRTPLTALKGFSQILKRSFSNSLSPEQIDYFSKIEKNADRLSNLFQDILNLSVIEAKNQLKKEELSCESITQTVISNVKQNYIGKNIQVNTIYNSQWVFADGNLFDQLLTNLIDNAFKYTPNDGQVSINWEEDATNTQLIISDSGMGIPKESILRIFERFYRVDPSRSRELGGTGLGLAIVKHIVQKHEGTISVNSEIGKGTKFKVLIPKLRK